MSIKNNIIQMNEFVLSKDSESLEKLLSYSDCKYELIKNYGETYEFSKLKELSEKFKGSVLKQKINLIFEDI